MVTLVHSRDIFVQVTRKYTEKIYLTSSLLTRSDGSVYAAAGAGFDHRTLTVPSVLHLVQGLINGHYTFRLYCSWCRLRSIDEMQF